MVICRPPPPFNKGTLLAGKRMVEGTRLPHHADSEFWLTSRDRGPGTLWQEKSISDAQKILQWSIDVR